MYCEYWNLHKAPFDNVPDPSMYADCHISMENVISETIFAIKEANEAFAVIIGGVGLGKTLSLRIIIDSLEPNKYKIVIITNPDISFTQLLKEIIGQVTGKPCEENRKSDLLEIFRRLLFTTMDQGQKIVIFIDEANALSPANLENLRLLTNLQDDQRNLFTLVLAGQMELGQRLEHPKRSSLFQRIGSYGRIDKLPTEEAVKTYIKTRLKLAGTKIKIFSDDCIPIIWEYSEHGIPRLINQICKLSLKAGETNHLDYISADIVLHISERFQKLSKTAVQKRKPRGILEDMGISDIVLSENELEETLLTETIPDKEAQRKIAKPVLPTTSEPIPAPPLPTEIPVTEVPLEESPLDVSLPITLIATQPEPEDKTLAEIIPDKKTQSEITEPILQTIPDLEPEKIALSTDISVPDLTIEESLQEIALPITPIAAQSETEDTRLPETVPDVETLCEVARLSTVENTEVKMEQDHFKDEKYQQAENENYDEIIIGEYKIPLAIPRDILKQVKSFNRENANKSAGFWAAQIIKKNPQLTSSPLADPVYIWNEIKDSILKRIAL